MKNLKNILFSVAIATIISNCGSPRFIAMPEELKDTITSSEALVESPQTEINTTIEKSNISTINDGLLFKLIEWGVDSHREGCAKDAVADVQKEFLQIPLRQKLSELLQMALAKHTWLHVKNVTFANDINSKETQELLKNSNVDAVITSKIYFTFNPQIDVLTGTIFCTIYPTGGKAKELVKTDSPYDKPIMKFEISATEVLKEASEEIEANGKKWVDNNGLFLRNAIDKILIQLSKDLEITLKNPSNVIESQ